MRSLSIQVQPAHSPGIDMAGVIAEFEAILGVTELVKHQIFDSGHDQVTYFNFNFGISDAQNLWQIIRRRLYNTGNFSSHMRQASMAMCSNEEGWDDYLLLYHFDPTVGLDDTHAL